MRISTAQFYETSATNYQRNYANVVKTGDEVASQTKLNTAADDSVGAARVLDLQQAGSMLLQYKSNINTVTTNEVKSETALNAITAAVQRAQELVLGASNASFTDKDRASNAAELKQLQGQILGLMNSQDANGNYLFAGSKTTNAPYSVNPDGTYSYQGDQSKINVDIGGGISMASNTTGWDAFEQAINTTRTSTTLTSPTTDDGMISLSGGSVSSSTAFDAKFGAGQPYTVTFLSSTTYKIVDGTGQDVTADASGAGTFTSTSAANQNISFRGLDLTLNVNLSTAQYKDPAQADAAMSALPLHEFTLTAASSTISTARLPSNLSDTVITGSSVTDQTQFNEQFPSGGAILKFTSATDFDLYAAPYDAATSKPVSSGSVVNDPVTGVTASAAGVTFTLSNANLQGGEVFTANSSTQQNQNILNTLSTIITSLNTPVDNDPIAKQKQQAALTSAIGNLKSAAEQVSTAIADGGARAATATSQGITNQTLIDNGTTEAGTITGSDPVDAIARLTLQKTMLQASQLVFTQLSALNLFSKL